MTDEAKRITQAIRNRDEAEMLLRRIGDSMVKLVRIFEQETKLVEAGQIARAAELTKQKADLAAVYLREIELLKSHSGFIGQTVPVLVDELRRAHQTFREILSHNLRVVATAQSVAEGILRGAADESNRRAAPKSYGADGKTTAAQNSRPVVISRAS